MARCEDSIPFPAFAGRIELHFHELVHVLQHQHVAVELHDAVVLLERKGGEFRPAVVEAWVVCEVLLHAGQEIFDVLAGDAAGGQGGVALGGEGVGVEGDEGVGGGVLFEGVVEG
jgi:hypothetical protein